MVASGALSGGAAVGAGVSVLPASPQAARPRTSIAASIRLSIFFILWSLSDYILTLMSQCVRFPSEYQNSVYSPPPSPGRQAVYPSAVSRHS